jgi:hypothetical protein
VWKTACLSHWSINALNFCLAYTSQLLELSRAELSSCHSWSTVVSWEAESCERRVLRFQRVILHGETGSGMHSHLREAGLTRLWWIPGAISGTLTVVGVDKITTKGPLQWGFNGWTFHSFTQMESPGLYRCLGVVRLTQSLIFERVNPRACICYLRMRSPISLRFPPYALG